MTFSINASRDCARAWEAMPWVLQGHATPEQAQWLDAHLAQCEACRVEYAQQIRLRDALSLPADVAVDANAGLKHLLDRLDAHDAEAALPAKARTHNSWLLRGLAAAVVLQALGIGMLGLKLYREQGAADYRTYSSQDAAPAPAGAIRVVPDAAMKVADWNTLVHALHLQVVGGPNEVGAYTVVSSGTATTQAEVVRQLRAARGIRMAEPVAAAP
ncbi:zf-HC2 domain-containing protein [Dyella marensis]|jgi:anti-sigma factor RsiW|uniref:Putative zinc-finger n=1 Tax=Dyella marensis TaxID=500610 RepID=A0A1I1XA64_9GAMM|nr:MULTISPECIES: zf-HC2 domain-containing protein [Dyella]SFE04284.1 Putative zinc-finger [Dyella marensis]